MTLAAYVLAVLLVGATGAPSPSASPAPSAVRPTVASAVGALRANAKLAICYDDMRLAFTDAYIAAAATSATAASPNATAIDAATAINVHLRPSEKTALAQFMLADVVLADAATPLEQSPWNGPARERLYAAAAAITAIDGAIVARIAERTATLPCHERSAAPKR